MAGLGTLLTRMATLGASPTLVVCGKAAEATRSTAMPEALPAASSAEAVALLAGNIRLPAGSWPPVVLANGASAISPVMPLPSTARMAWSSCTPLEG